MANDEKLPRNPNLPTPLPNKPPLGYTRLEEQEMLEAIRTISREHLERLLIKGWNGGAYRLYKKDPTSAGVTEGPDGGDPPDDPDMDDIAGWPP